MGATKKMCEKGKFLLKILVSVFYFDFSNRAFAREFSIEILAVSGTKYDAFFSSWNFFELTFVYFSKKCFGKVSK